MHNVNIAVKNKSQLRSSHPLSSPGPFHIRNRSGTLGVHSPGGMGQRRTSDIFVYLCIFVRGNLVRGVFMPQKTCSSCFRAVRMLLLLLGESWMWRGLSLDILSCVGQPVLARGCGRRGRGGKEPGCGGAPWAGARRSIPARQAPAGPAARSLGPLPALLTWARAAPHPPGLRGPPPWG